LTKLAPLVTQGIGLVSTKVLAISHED